MRLAGRSALVTGASRNIGRAIALAFAAEGADLLLNTRANGDELEAVGAECRKAGVRVVTALADIGDASAVAAMVERGLAELGAIDVLVCNAAIRPHKAIEETTLEEWHRVFAVDLHSAFYLARAVVPSMKARGRGSIIALGGQSSLTGRPNTAAVTAAKTGLLGLVRALAAELGPSGIRANMVVPGFIDTERRYAEWYPEFRERPPGAPEQVKEIPLAPARAAGGHRRGVRLSRLRRLELRHRRRPPRDGRPGHRLSARRPWTGSASPSSAAAISASSTLPATSSTRAATSSPSATPTAPGPSAARASGASRRGSRPTTRACSTTRTSTRWSS